MTQKRVIIVEAERWQPNYPPEEILAFKDWFNEHLASIPPEYQKDAKLEIETYSGYEDSIDLSITISYYRPETEAEKLQREDATRRRQLDAEHKERQAYERLKAKFGS